MCMRKQKKRDGEKGMSLIEILPLVIVITTLFSFLLGAWGIAHKNILSSIGARTYAFETFNNRADVTYFSDNRASLSRNDSYEATESRYHGVGYDSPNEFSAPITPLRYVAGASVVNSGQESLHKDGLWNNDQFQRGQEIQRGSVSEITHVWITVGYGICINSNCGD